MADGKHRKAHGLRFSHQEKSVFGAQENAVPGACRETAVRCVSRTGSSGSRIANQYPESMLIGRLTKGADLLPAAIGPVPGVVHGIQVRVHHGRAADGEPFVAIAPDAQRFHVRVALRLGVRPSLAQRVDLHHAVGKRVGAGLIAVPGALGLVGRALLRRVDRGATRGGAEGEHQEHQGVSAHKPSRGVIDIGCCLSLHRPNACVTHSVTMAGGPGCGAVSGF